MDIKDVENLAELARLELSEEEKKAMTSDLGEMLAYVKVIQEADTNEVAFSEEIYNVWREDVPGVPPFSQKLLVEQFPESQDGFLKVKKIL